MNVREEVFLGCWGCRSNGRFDGSDDLEKGLIKVRTSAGPKN